jgi:hypothetical protein
MNESNYDIKIYFAKSLFDIIKNKYKLHLITSPFFLNFINSIDRIFPIFRKIRIF